MWGESRRLPREAVAHGAHHRVGGRAARNPRGTSEEGRSAAGRAAGRHPGRQAHVRSDSALPSAGAVARATSSSRREKDGYLIEARVRTTGRTGVEMEALTAVSVAALTIYDMLKALDKSDGDRRDLS